MLGSMVAMPTLDLIVSIIWVGALAIALLVQALYAWVGHRYWARSAREAERLAAATRPAPPLKVLPGGRVDAPATGERPDIDLPAEA